MEGVGGVALLAQAGGLGPLSNAALFRCVAAAEEALVAGQRFGKNPANTIGSYLNAEFGKRGWVKPTNPSMWREYFVAHHMEDLL